MKKAVGVGILLNLRQNLISLFSPLPSHYGHSSLTQQKTNKPNTHNHHHYQPIPQITNSLWQPEGGSVTGQRPTAHEEGQKRAKELLGYLT